MSLVILAALFMGLAGCAKKNVRHLASDVCLVTPEQTTKEQVLSYLGQPDEQYEMVKVQFGEDIVKTCVYRLLTEEEFQEGGLGK